jgi:hypothetical protein
MTGQKPTNCGLLRFANLPLTVQAVQICVETLLMIHAAMLPDLRFANLPLLVQAAQKCVETLLTIHAAITSK